MRYFSVYHHAPMHKRRPNRTVNRLASAHLATATSRDAETPPPVVEDEHPFKRPPSPPRRLQTAREELEKRKRRDSFWKGIPKQKEVPSKNPRDWQKDDKINRNGDDDALNDDKLTVLNARYNTSVFARQAGTVIKSQPMSSSKRGGAGTKPPLSSKPKTLATAADSHAVVPEGDSHAVPSDASATVVSPPRSKA